MMLGALRLFARTAQIDLARLRQRMAVAAVCYAIASLVFVAAFGLGAAAAIILLVERYGSVAGLAIAAVILALVGVGALAVNAILRMRQRRLKRHAAAVRAAAMANTTAAGAEQAREAAPYLLPAAAILAFALTNSFLKSSDS